jgi:hypothetical protein
VEAVTADDHRKALDYIRRICGAKVTTSSNFVEKFLG